MSTQQKQPENVKYFIRIQNTDLPGAKQIMFALTHIKGVSVMFAHAICQAAEISPKAIAGKLSDAEIAKLNLVVKSPSSYHIPSWMYNRRGDIETGKDIHVITSDLDYVKSNDIKHMQKIRCYKGVRHSHGLPVRGQRTRSNFRKNKGKATGVYKSKSGPGAAPAKSDGKK